MAFGKDTKNLGSVGAFRQGNFQQRARGHMQQQHEQRSRKGGGGSRFSGQFRPSTDELDLVRIIPGKYKVQQPINKDELGESILEYWPYCEHFHGTRRKSTVCSAGPWAGDRKKREPCRGCDIFWATFEKDANGKTKKGPMSKRDMYVFSVFNYDTFYKTEQTDEDGGIKRNPETGDAYFTWVQARGEHSALKRAEGIEKRVGMMMHWPMGQAHFNQLLDFGDEIGVHCRSCMSRDSIVRDAILCGNEECGDAIIDMATTSLPEAKIKEMMGKECRCPTCNQISYPTEAISCKECKEPSRASMFDVDMKVKRVASPTSDGTVLRVSSYDLRPITSDNQKNIRLLDLPALYRPDTIERQIAYFGEVPQARNREDVGRAYGGNKGGNGDPYRG